LTQGVERLEVVVADGLTVHGDGAIVGGDQARIDDRVGGQVAEGRGTRTHIQVVWI
jgi:hypothetical protein